MLLSTGVGWAAEASGFGCLLAATRERRAWPRRHLTIAGAALCLMIAPGACVGGFYNHMCKDDPAGGCHGALP